MFYDASIKKMTNINQILKTLMDRHDSLNSEIDQIEKGFGSGDVRQLIKLRDVAKHWILAVELLRKTGRSINLVKRPQDDFEVN